MTCRLKYRLFPAVIIVFSIAGYFGWYFITSFYREVKAADITTGVDITPDVSLTTSPVSGMEEYLPVDEGEIVRHIYYTLSFNNYHKQANWVYYRLKLDMGQPVAERSDNFREDKMVRTGSAKPSDYAKSGYDRGHLCPAADMGQSHQAMSETFYMSNMSPQAPSFNRGIWKKLEEQVRSWAKRELIYIVTGPVFRDKKGIIGKSRVTVPGYYYKVLYSPSRKEMIAFVLPNEKCFRPIPDYAVSVDSVEHLTGIDFFPQLPDSLENRLESNSDYGRW